MVFAESCGYFLNILKAVAFPSLLIKSSFLPFNPSSGVAVGKAARVVHIE